ncbi:hypothetical protein EC988_007519, partial [Linderina pennispora]
MMELLLNAAKEDLNDEDMEKKWQDRYQSTIRTSVFEKFEVSCIEKRDWFTCKNNRNGSEIKCPSVQYQDRYDITYDLRSGKESEFADYVNGTLGMDMGVIDMHAEYNQKVVYVCYDPPEGRDQKSVPNRRHRRQTEARPVIQGRPKSCSGGHYFLPGLVADYPPKMGVVLSNFTNSATASLKDMQYRLDSRNTDLNDLYQGVIQVIVRTQSGNDTLDQFYRYQNWVEEQKEMDAFLKNFIIELIIGTLIGGIIDFGIGLIGQAIKAAAQAIKAATTFAKFAKEIGGALKAAEQMKGVSKVVKLAAEGAKISKEMFTKIWGTLPKNVQGQFTRLAPKLEKAKGLVKSHGCDAIEHFVGFDIPSDQSVLSSSVSFSPSTNVAKKQARTDKQ